MHFLPSPEKAHFLWTRFVVKQMELASMHEPARWAGRQICEPDFPPWLQGWGQPHYPGGAWQPRLPCPCPLRARECESSSNCSAHSSGPGLTSQEEEPRERGCWAQTRQDPGGCDRDLPFSHGLSVLCVAPKSKPGTRDRSHKETDLAQYKEWSKPA